MTFLKRHWPDLLISSLIVALLAGFALVFFGPSTPRGTEAERARTEASGPVASTPRTSQTASPPESETAAANPATGTQEAGTEAAATGEPNTDEPGAGEAEEMPTIPSQGGDEASRAGESAEGPVVSAPEITVAPTPAPEPPSTEPPNTEPPNKPAPAPPTREGAPVATSRAGLPTRSDYRLSAGVFNNEAVARERTASIAALGYQVHLIAVEQGVVAQVGPFADRDTAARAAADIRREFPGITLYSPVVRGDGQASPVTSAPSSTSTSPTNQSAPAQSTSTPAAPSAESSSAPPVRSVPAAPVYLQVGAFDRQERAAEMVSRLRAEGIAAEVNAPPGRKVRVLVGPFSGNALLSTEDKLRSLGVDHFRVQ